MLLGGLLSASLTGCTSTSGLLLRSGPHKILQSAEMLAGQNCRAIGPPRELEKQVLDDYRVEPGDVLVIEPVDFNSPVRLPGDLTVLPDGLVELGRYGRLPVTGMNTSEIETEVQRRIDAEHREEEGSRNGSTRISVRLDQAESKVYYVLGEVNAPGAFPIVGRETVLDAIVKAGGLADRANRHNILLSRPTPPESCREVLPICYQQIVQLGDTTTNYQVQPGDRIYVPSLTLCREMAQTLAPWHAERCPYCTSPTISACSSGSPQGCPVTSDR
jgi:polysaccharide export outer membrane protein